MAPVSSRYIATLALVAGAILVVGSLLRPNRKTTDAAPAPSEGDLVRLAQLSERRSLENQTAYFAAIADRVRSSLVRLPDEETTGVVWEASLVVSSPTASPGMTATLVTGTARVNGEPVAFGPTMPIVGLEVQPASGLNPAARPALPPHAGDWLVAVWTSDQPRSFAAGNLDVEAAVRCGESSARELLTTIPLAPVMAGGGLFDADGNLLAVLTPCGERTAALTVSSVDALLAEARGPEGRLLAEVGIRVDALSEDEAAYFKHAEGVLIREVWTGYPGAVAGLEPGDLVVAIEATPVTVPADLQLLVAPTTTPATITVRRRAATMSMALSRGVAPPRDATDVGLVWTSTPPGYVIAAVVPNSVAARAGIQPGDRLVRIDHLAPPSRAQLERLLSGSHTGPVFVELERRGRHWGVLLS
jgi:PDZ domain